MMELLRLARPEDWGAINALSRQVLALHVNWCPEEYNMADTPYPKELFQELIQEEALYAAWQDGALVGYVCFRVWQTNGEGSVYRKVLFIDDIGVDNRLKNRGIGRKIMADLQELAKSQGCTHLQLSVDIHNENAQAFYKACGFHIRNLGMGKAL